MTTRSRLLALVALLLAALSFAASAGAAADLVLTGTSGDDTLSGGPAAESLFGLEGNDRIAGQGGDDELDGGPGADTLSGGEGADVVSYAGSAPVSVTLDGVADDGAQGEGDNVAVDVEDVFGGDGADQLVGSAVRNTIDGGAGNDAIEGGEGRDALIGGDGDDTITAQDGEVDAVDCGPGTDKAVVDPEDRTEGCEIRDTTPQAGSGRAVPRFEPLFATRRSGRRTAMLLGIPRFSNVAVGSRVSLRCLRACSVATSGTITKRSPKLMLQRSARITRSSRVRITVSLAGRISRYTDYRFRWVRGIVTARAFAGGCALDDAGRRTLKCP